MMASTFQLSLTEHEDLEVDNNVGHRLISLNSTINDNSGVGIFNFGGSNNGGGSGITNGSGGIVRLRNIIVANNSGTDLSGTFFSEDYNFIGNTFGATFTGTTTHNLTNAPA